MSGYQELSDNELITLLREGDHIAYTEIYERYYEIAFIEAYRKVKDENVAQDILHDLFTILWHKRANAPSANNLAGYFIVAVRNRVLKYFAHQGVKNKHLQFFKHQNPQPQYSPADHAVREKELQLYIDRAVQSLPSKMKHVFQLNRDKNLSYKEIAQELDISENNVQKHINGALKVLRTKLSGFF